MSESPIIADGRIPFRIRVGVTGHRQLGRKPGLDEVVRGQVRRIATQLLPALSTTVQLGVVSQLAEGADRLIVREVRAEADERHQDAHLEAFLPLQSDVYAEVQGFADASRKEFERLMNAATLHSEMTTADAATPEARAAAYESASRQLVARCDVLIALWDGEKTGGRGGTAETLLYAAARSKPCIWISTSGASSVRDNFVQGESETFYREIERRAALRDLPTRRSAQDPPGGVLGPMLASFRALDEFNRERLASDYRSRLNKELLSRTGVADWVAAPFLRATLLAGRWRRRFKWASWLITAFAALAAVMLAVSLSFGQDSSLWPLAEGLFFLCALAGLVTVRRFAVHGRWLSYRVLAERLRSAYFLASTGADFRRQARLDAVYIGQQSTDWLMRAFEEIWDRRPKTSPTKELQGEELDDLKHWLADDWVGEQIHYFANRARHHRRWHWILTATVGAFFGATIVFAFLHAFRQGEAVSTFFSIALPAAGASLGVLLTINQHQALNERYTRMGSDLAVVRQNLLDANSDTVDKASSEAARVIAQETGAWFGSMWFLDIEHP